MITIKIQGDKELIAKLDAMPEKVRLALQKKVTVFALRMEAIVKRKLSGQVLQKRSGNLRDSIFHEVTATDNSVVGKVAASMNVKYAAIHEYGGTIKHPGGTAYFIGKDKMAHFISNKVAFAMGDWPRTKPHDINIPARPYMRPTLAEMKDEIVKGMTDAVKEGLQ